MNHVTPSTPNRRLDKIGQRRGRGTGIGQVAVDVLRVMFFVQIIQICKNIYISINEIIIIIM